MRISSLQNPKIKNVIKLLRKSSERTQQNLFAVEGVQENQYAIQNQYTAVELFLQPEIFSDTIQLPPRVPVFEVSAEVYQKMAYREGTEGIIGVYRKPNIPFNITHEKRILILEGIEKPGNLGAIIRSALAFGIEVIFLANSALDPYNPNVIRSSVGTVFCLPIVTISNENAYQLIQHSGFTLYGTQMHLPAQPLQNVRFEDKAALLFGTEHSGISEFWNDKIDVNFIIPMQHGIDSLNLSNSIAISLYALN